MYVVGITGGIGAGKSKVMEYLNRKENTFILETDKLAHELMNPGHFAYKKIIDEFSENILDENMKIDRKILGKIVLENNEKLKTLNSIIHPAVKEYIKKDILKKAELGYDFYFIEAALLIQDGYREICDSIWYISATIEVRKERIKHERGYSDDKANAFLINQPDDLFYKNGSDIVINNNQQFDETKTQIDAILIKYC